MPDRVHGLSIAQPEGLESLLGKYRQFTGGGCSTDPTQIWRRFSVAGRALMLASSFPEFALFLSYEGFLYYVPRLGPLSER